MRYLRLITSTFFFAASFALNAQEFGELDLINVRFRMFADGFAGHRPGIWPFGGLEIPQGSNNNLLYSSGLWLTGSDPQGGLHTAAWLYGGQPESRDYFPGPLRIDGSAGTSQLSSDAYHQVWVVSRDQVERHLSYYTCLTDPNCDMNVMFPNGYATPAAFTEWPAMGDAVNGYDAYLAPFYDFNSDGAYDPQVGDAPCILGDQALFLVFNDNLASHTVTYGLPFGIEVQVMGFVYNGTNPALGQTVFLRYHLINRSATTYEDFTIGYFSDIDVGCSNDDFGGTDPSRNLQFFYNWQDVDDPCLGAPGFGEQPPAIGMVLLKGPLLDEDESDDEMSNALPAWNGKYFGDGIIDNERHGLSFNMQFHREVPIWAMTDPSSPIHYRNFLQGRWKDGVEQTYGGNGYSTDPASIPSRYAFPGSNDPFGAGTGGAPQAAWLETSPTPSTPDRRAIMSSGPITLDPGEHVDLLFAYVYTRAGSGGAIASVAALQARVDSVRAFAQSLPIWDIPENQPYAGMCMDYATIGVAEANVARALTFFPSPADDIVHFAAPLALAGGMLSLRDATGRMILQQRIQPDRNSIDVRALAKGVYLYEAVARNARFTGRIVKE